MANAIATATGNCISDFINGLGSRFDTTIENNYKGEIVCGGRLIGLSRQRVSELLDDMQRNVRAREYAEGQGKPSKPVKAGVAGKARPEALFEGDTIGLANWIRAQLEGQGEVSSIAIAEQTGASNRSMGNAVNRLINKAGLDIDRVVVHAREDAPSHTVYRLNP